MNNQFSQFEAFGAVADEKSRALIADALYQTLQTQSKITLSNAQTENFADALGAILDNQTMRELCAKDASLAEHITNDICTFINKTKREMHKTDNPFEHEQELLHNFEQSNKMTFNEIWQTTAPFIQQTYKNILDVEFYEKEFAKSLIVQKNKNTKKQITYASVKEHFTGKWGGLLLQKQIQWELDFIESRRKKFCQELYAQIESLKKLQELLAPFTGELGRLWDMSKGRWQKVNFDILAKYAALLERDASLRELAEMLGRARQAEREYEEEIFSQLVIKPDIKIDHASKSDLVGVHESNDISDMLPAEAALLADETTELLFYKKYTEKKLQTFEYNSKFISFKEIEEKKARQKIKEDKKGPFIICVDTSGSMHGTPETVAKTLCFALLKTAVRENRLCYLISFSTEIETLNLTDIKNNLEKLLDFLSMSFYGGTDAAPAMQEALRMFETKDYKKADVIMVSDFVMDALTDEVKNKIQAARKNKTKFHSLVIGESQNKNVIECFDNNWFYRNAPV